MYYELQKSKRGKKCNMCGGFINKDEFYFSTTDFNPTFPYPIKKATCMKCCETITTEEFIGKLKGLYDLCMILSVKLANQKKHEDKVKKEPVF